MNYTEIRNAFPVRGDSIVKMILVNIPGGAEVTFGFANGEEETVKVHPIQGGKIVGATMEPISGGVRVIFSIEEEVPGQPKVRQPQVLQIPVNSLEGMSPKELDTWFPIVDPRRVLDHPVMRWNPETGREEELLNNLKKARDMLPPFRTNAIAPSIGKDGAFGFMAGYMPAVGYTPECYENTCRKVMPSKRSRIATNLHQAAFLGFVMTQLMDKMGCTADEAWHAVCRNSKDVGHYRDSEGALGRFEPTGSRPVGGCYDLGNTGTVVRDIDKLGVYHIYGGDYATRGGDSCLANHHPVHNPDDIICYAVPRIVMEV